MNPLCSYLCLCWPGIRKLIPFMYDNSKFNVRKPFIPPCRSLCILTWRLQTISGLGLPLVTLQLTSAASPALTWTRADTAVTSGLSEIWELMRNRSSRIILFNYSDTSLVSGLIQIRTAAQPIRFITFC